MKFVKIIQSIVFSAVIILGLFSSVCAEDKFITSCPEDQVLFSTGTEKNTFHQAMQNYIAKVPGVICERTDSSGGAKNVEFLLGLGGDAEAGIVPMDVMEFMRRTNPDVVKLRSICSLWGNALHPIVSVNGYKVEKWGGISSDIRYIQNFSDLEGKKVATFGSPVQSVELIEERMKRNFFGEKIPVSSIETGLRMLEEGKVQAFLVMGGYPISYINNLDPKKYTLANVDAAFINQLGAPYYETRLNYPKLGVNGFRAITAKNEVIVRDYDDPAWAERFIKLYKGFKENMKTFQQMRGGHPAWRTVENIDDIYWTPYTPVREYSKQQGSSSSVKGEEQGPVKTKSRR